MRQATADIGAEGTVSKAVRSLYRGGRRSRFWLKAKHSRTHTFQVAGWRPSTASRPGGLILAEDDQPVAVAHPRPRRQRPTGPRRPPAPLRTTPSHRYRHHPQRLPHRHRPLHLTHPHQPTPQRTIRPGRLPCRAETEDAHVPCHCRRPAVGSRT
jgi:hypothetical protein